MGILELVFPWLLVFGLLVAMRRLEGWLPWQAARAWLCEQAGETEAARAALDAALALAPPPAERLFLEGARRRLG